MEEDTIVIYSAPGHMNTMSLLAKFISKHHPKIPIVILCTADADSAAAVSGVPSITYRRLPTPALPPDITDNCVELMFEIPRLNNANLREALHEISQKARIRAFIIDFFCNSGFEVSESMEIPTYHYFSAGAAMAIYSLCYAEIHETITVDLGEFKDFIEFPGLPLIYSLDFPRDALLRQSIFNKHIVCLSKYMRKSRGFIVNAFDALDYRAKEAISNGLCLPNEPTPPVYFMGPLVGDVEGGAKHECLSWLDKQPSKSVVFLCFGRRGVFSAEQIKETAIGLEKSGHRFLWAVRSPMDGGEADLDAALPEGFMERTKERGLVVKSWAPQREVLSHDSVGGFVTHCGRSSIFEGLWFGVPMIGWPMDAEQRMNRTVLVEDMRVAELGQGEAIAQNLRTMFGLKVPIVSIVIGEGGSGGALAIGCANKLLMLENAVFYVASPEACAAILWKTAKASPKAAEKLKITATELSKLQICDGIIPEPLGGAHTDPYWTSQQIKTAIVESMDELMKMDTETLLKHRAQKFRKLGGFQEGIPIDPKKKINMRKKDDPIVPISKTSESELRDEVEKLKLQVMQAGGKSSAEQPETGLKEMVAKLEREIDYEYDEAAKALGLEDKILMLREEVGKGRNLNDQLAHPALKEKIDQVKNEFDKNLPLAPNYPSLKSKLDMLKELSKAFNLSKTGTSKDELRNEINKRFGALVDRPDLKQKIETLKAEIANSGATDLDSNPGLKEKVLQLTEDLESEFKAVLNSVGLQVIPSTKEAVGKLSAFDEEVGMIIDDVVNTSDLREKIELLKTEVEKSGNTPTEDSKIKIQALAAEIKQSIAEAISSPELKEKHERLAAELLEADKSSVGSNGSLVKEDAEDSQVKVNVDANSSVV